MPINPDYAPIRLSRLKPKAELADVVLPAAVEDILAEFAKEYEPQERLFLRHMILWHLTEDQIAKGKIINILHREDATQYQKAFRASSDFMAQLKSAIEEKIDQPKPQISEKITAPLSVTLTKLEAKFLGRIFESHAAKSEDEKFKILNPLYAEDGKLYMRMHGVAKAYMEQGITSLSALKIELQ